VSGRESLCLFLILGQCPKSLCKYKQGIVIHGLIYQWRSIVAGLERACERSTVAHKKYSYYCSSSSEVE